VTAWSARLVFADYDPYFALFNFWSGEVAWSALLILGVVLVLSLFVERPFCKYACPYGATLGLFNLFRIFGIKRNAASCIKCGRCDSVCPMNIQVSGKAVVRDHQCISCLKCTSEYVCPVTNTVELKVGRFTEVRA
jgi:polyferredoxin